MILNNNNIIVIVPVKDNVTQIEGCIKSILRETIVGGLIVVCDRCTDGTYELVKNMSKNNDRLVVVLKDWTRGGRHLGHKVSEVINVGLSTVDSKHEWDSLDYVAFIGSDTMIIEGYLDRAVSMLMDNENLGCVGINLDGSNIDSGSVVRRSILRELKCVPSSAREGTALHKKITDMGYDIKFLPYKNDGILLHVSSDDSFGRRIWGARGIGYSQYEIGRGLPHVFKSIPYMLIRYKSLEGIIYVIGWIEAFFVRAKKV